jgi:hypothetical protein
LDLSIGFLRLEEKLESSVRSVIKSCGDWLDRSALALSSDLGENNWSSIFSSVREFSFEGHGRPLSTLVVDCTSIDPGSIIEESESFFNNHVGKCLGRVGSVKVVPFGHLPLEGPSSLSILLSVGHSDCGWVTAVNSGWAHDHNRILEHAVNGLSPPVSSSGLVLFKSTELDKVGEWIVRYP